MRRGRVGVHPNLKDVPMDMERFVDRLRVKALHRDLDGLLALGIAALLLLFPPAQDAFQQNADTLSALLSLAFGGRFAVRFGGVIAAGIAARDAVVNGPTDEDLAIAFRHGRLTARIEAEDAVAVEELAADVPTEVGDDDAPSDREAKRQARREQQAAAEAIVTDPIPF